MKNITLKKLTRSVALTLGLCGAGLTQAATIQAVGPLADQNLNAGVGIQIYLSDMGANVAPSLSAFDLDIAYDASVLQLDGVSFGTGLDVLTLGSMQGTDSAQPGSLNVYEISFDDVATLNDLQPDSFALLTLYFTTIGTGTSVIDINVLSLVDAYGESFTADAVIEGAVTVVPVPAALPLLMSGLLTLAGLARASRRAS